jgi:hypothetical protein
MLKTLLFNENSIYNNNSIITNHEPFQGHTRQFSSKFYFREAKVDLTAKQNYQLQQL